MSLPAGAKYGGGTGGPNDPYLIYTAEQMNEIGANRKEWDKHFKLMADIDLSAYAERDFKIIGRGMNNAFKGVSPTPPRANSIGSEHDIDASYSLS